jgi:MerR family transcriptional regulator, copper efflux regulator
MARDGLSIGEVAAKSGVSRKALRLYEKAGILPPARRTGSGYRVYEPETLALLGFVTQARRLGFRLDEIKRIVTLKRSGRTPCKHVLDLVHLKLENIEQALTDLAEVRGQLRGLLRSWRSRRYRSATVCPCVQHLTVVKEGGENHGEPPSHPLPGRLRSVPGRGDRGRRSADRRDRQPRRPQKGRVEPAR